MLDLGLIFYCILFESLLKVLFFYVFVNMVASCTHMRCVSNTWIWLLFKKICQNRFWLIVEFKALFLNFSCYIDHSFAHSWQSILQQFHGNWKNMLRYHGSIIRVDKTIIALALKFFLCRMIMRFFRLWWLFASNFNRECIFLMLELLLYFLF